MRADRATGMASPDISSPPTPTAAPTTTPAARLYPAEARVYADALLELARQDPRVYCLTADLAKSTEVDAFARSLPDRFLNLGMTEQNMMGVASGLARCGEVPFVHTFAVFATRRPFDQIGMSIAYPRLSVKLVGFLPGLTTPGGVTHQAIDDLALMRALPGMVVLDPADAVELRQLPGVMAAHQGPVYARAVRGRVPVVFGSSHRLEIGKAVWARDGADATVVSCGAMTLETLEAADLLEEEGLHVGVLHSPSVKPLDDVAILAAARQTGALVTAENHTILGGLGSAVAECLAESGLGIRFARVGVRDTYAEGGSVGYLFEKYGLSARQIAVTVRRLLGRDLAERLEPLDRKRSGSLGV